MNQASSIVAPRLSIDRILHPGSVAVFGASDNKDKFGGRIMHFLVRHGFAGDIVPINPNRDAVLGRQAYPEIGAVPKAPDVAILAVPPKILVENVAAAAEAGVGCCVVMTTGFAEAGEEGLERQQALQRITRETGLRLVGPNCMGLIVPHHNMALCSSVVLDTDRLRDGPIGLVSQSGALMVSILDRASEDGIGFRHCVSLGNQADLEICDFLEYMIEDPSTEALCVYAEGFVDAGRFRRAAAAARKAGKPLFVVKTGRTPAGVKSARSHTASLAGSFEAFKSVCEAEGVVLARDPDDMVRAAYTIARFGKPKGDGIAVLSSSGGGAGISVDRISEEGQRLAELSPGTLSKLGEMLLPPQATNPVDLGGRKLPEQVEIAGEVATVLGADPDVAMTIAVLTSMPFFATRAKLIGECGLATGKPLLAAVTPGAAGNAPRSVLRDLGLVPYRSLPDAITVTGLLSDYYRLSLLPRGKPVRPADLPAGPGKLPVGQLIEAEAKALVSAYGIPVPREATVATPAAAAEAAAAIGFPVVVKVVARAIVHKSDVGGVKVGLASAADVLAAANDMEARLAPEGYSVQSMEVGGVAEMIIGVRRDLQFGAVVMVGVGGTLVELLDDIALAPAPVTPETARILIGRLRMAAVLNGVRGRPPADIEAVVDAVVRLSWLAADLGEALDDIEVNPIIVRPAGQGLVAVDARALLA